MEKHIITWSYWLGMVSVILAILGRGLDVLGSNAFNFLTKGNSVGYWTFRDGAILFFLIAIATASYSWADSQGPRS